MFSLWMADLTLLSQAKVSHRVPDYPLFAQDQTLAQRMDWKAVRKIGEPSPRNVAASPAYLALLNSPHRKRSAVYGAQRAPADQLTGTPTAPSSAASNR